LFLQTIYYPYSWGLEYARGSVLRVLTDSPTYEVAGMGQVPYLDVVGTRAEDGKVSLFLLNRDLAQARAVEVNWQDQAPGGVLASWVMTGDDLKAVNSFVAPRKVVPQALAKPTTTGGKTKFEVPARSYSVIQWGA
jgi:alpha-L-arabinofuranosidase